MNCHVKLELEVLKQFGLTAAAWLSPFGAEVSLEYLVRAAFL